MRSIFGSLMAIWIVGLFCVASPLAGCGSSECLDCGGDNSCPPLYGTYVGNQEGSLDTCGSWYLLEGTTTIRVVTQNDNDLELEFEDTQGMWALFTGKICNTKKQDPPRSYAFNTTFDITGNPDYQVMYTLSGTITEAHGETPAHMEGIMSINLFFPDRPESDCNLSGNFSGDQVQ